jgi:hypothetical protein
VAGVHVSTDEDQERRGGRACIESSTDEDPEIIRGNREQLVETQSQSEPIRANQSPTELIRAYQSPSVALRTDEDLARAP